MQSEHVISFTKNNNFDSAWLDAQLWLWKQRRNAPPNADIWDLRFYWGQECQQLWRAVCEEKYQLSPMRIYHKKTHESLAQWSARDALILKWAAIHAQDRLPIHERCEHSKGHGGVVKSVARLQEAIKTSEYKFVLRTDIRGYYQHIRKHQLWKQISHYISDTRVTNLIRQYLYYCVDDGGEIHTPQTGIPRGCALSPLLGGSLLYFVDMEFNATEGIYYARYMDDFMVLTRTRWQLRKCVARLNEYFEWGGVTKHPEKTYIGKLSHGMDWLGVQFDESGATGISARALKRHRERCLTLYKHACTYGFTHNEAMSQIQAYRIRWLKWVQRLMAFNAS